MMHSTAQPAVLFKKVPHMPIENILEYSVFPLETDLQAVEEHEFMSEMALYSHSDSVSHATEHGP